MKIKLARDIWRVALVATPIAEIWRAGGIAAEAVRLLPEEGPMRFLADPFGLERDGRRHVFAERYDYRDRRGAIDWLEIDGAGRVLARGPAIEEAWHLSYPIPFEADGETWMLPEASRSGGLHLYRALDFPRRWTRVATIALDVVPVDATPVRHGGRWWLFYTALGRHDLHCAWAEAPGGPWHPHPYNPVRRGAEGSRPGGTAAVVDGRLVLPVQDCGATYGGAIRPLWIDRLTPHDFAAELGAPLRVPASLAPYLDGLHTLSALGEATLIDVKRIELSARSLAVLAARAFRGRASARR